MRLVNRQHFLNALLRYNKLHPVYHVLKYNFNQNEFVNKDGFNEHKYEKSLFYFNYCFPRYLNPQIGGYKKLSFKLPSFIYKSYGIIIDKNFESAEDYLNSHFSKKQRYSIRKGKALLEQCFDIKTKVFFGKIEREEFDSIMNKASEFLVARFKQRNEDNENLAEWDTYCKCLYPLIKKKRASIFVIYNGSDPIQITINFNINKTCFGTMLIYDVDYSKFSMGHIGVYNLLDWAIRNKYDFLDMGMGTFHYKTKWSNFSYELETQIFFDGKQKALNLIGHILKILFIIKYIFIALKFKIKFKKIEKMRKKAPLPEQVQIKKRNKLEDSDLINIDFIQIGKYENLRKAVNDFLFVKKTHESSVKLYKNEKNTFYIKSKNEMFEFNLQ